MTKWQFNLTLVNFLLTDYLSFKLTSKKAIKTVADYKYFTFTKNLPKASYNLSYATKTAKFLPDNNTI